MKHAIFATCGALVVAGGLSLSAQTPTPQRPQAPTPSPSTPSRTDGKDKLVTVAGCLKAWDATTGGAAAAPPAATATTPVQKFVLTNVEEASASERTTAKPSTGTVNQQYILMADSAVNLAAHLNHKVLVSGKVTTTMEHAAAPTARTSDPAKPTETPRTGVDRMGMEKSWSTLTVSSLTMMSTTCPGATE